MSITPNDLLNIAEKLSKEQDEASFRTSIGRYYYAGFHSAKQWHINLNYPGSNRGPAGGIHQELINQLSNPSPKITEAKSNSSKKIAYFLTSTKCYRTTADYRLDSLCDKGIVASVQSEIKKIFELCQ